MKTLLNISAKSIALVLLVTTLYSMLAIPVHAQSSVLPLQVAPARQEITVDPGDTTAVSVRFFNLSDLPASGFVRAADFIVTDNAGTPSILEGVTQTSPRFSASGWVEMPFDRMSIAANDKVSVQAIIKVPANARPGGRYLAIYFEPTGSLPSAVGVQEAGTRVSQRLAALVYIRVNGPITEKALVSRIFAPTFQEYGPIDVEADVLNKGDYHIAPQGSISLKNMLGGFIDQRKIESANIFPDTVRTFKNTIGKKWMFGKYDVEVQAAYGTTGQVIKRSVSIWVFPWKVALVILLALIIVIVLIRNLYRRLIVKENTLESEIKKDHDEIQKLKEQLDRKS